ncbi:MAG TPA: hypothetical protein VM428_00205 [Microlunatus sp.]|jgi:hypothetical protein|nr:hypothetical protein [Microlunatus sp.]
MPRWKRPHANHELRADDCRRHPGVWIEIGPYSSGYSAKSTARHINHGTLSHHYAPAGAFETRVDLTDTGATLYARYIGDTA